MREAAASTGISKKRARPMGEMEDVVKQKAARKAAGAALQTFENGKC